MQANNQNVQKQVQLTQPLDDNLTGLKNDQINKNIKTVQYQSTKTLLALQEDQSNIQRFNILKNETFSYFKKQIGPCSIVDLLKQLIADVEYIFWNDRKSGNQKQDIVYQSALQYLFQIEGINYDTYTKNNLLIQIDELFKTYKKDLLKMCVEFHSGLEMPKKQGCMRQ